MNLEIIIAIIGFFLALLGIILTIRSRQRKDISLAVLRSESTTYVTQELRKDVKIYFKDQPVEKLNLIEIIFKNTGNTNIDGSQIFKNKPISIYTHEELRILHSLIIPTGREGIYPQISKISDQEIKLNFDILKPNEIIRLRIYTTADIEDLKIKGRIQEIEDLNEKELPFLNIPIKGYYNILLPGIILMLLYSFIVIHSIYDDTKTFFNKKYVILTYTDQINNFKSADSLNLVKEQRHDSLYYTNGYCKADTIIRNEFLISNFRIEKIEYYYFRKTIRKERLKNIIENIFKLDTLIFLSYRYTTSLIFLVLLSVITWILFHYRIIHLLTTWKMLTKEEKLRIVPNSLKFIIRNISKLSFLKSRAIDKNI